MSKLNIQPVVYDGRRLNEVGDRVVSVFYPLFDDYKINDELGFLDLDSIVLRDGESDPSQRARIVGPDFPRFLSNYGSPVLGVTSITSTRSKNDGWVYGIASKNYNAAYVSTARPEFDSAESNIHVERLIIEALHELGHVFALQHHESPKRTSNRKSCPMDTSHAEKARSGIISWGEYLSQRNPEAFCRECYGQLGISIQTERK